MTKKWVQFRLIACDYSRRSKVSLQEALKERVWDDDQHVLEELYKSPELLLPVVSDTSFVKTFSEFLAKRDMARPLLRLHFKFLCGEFCSGNPSLVTPTLLQVLFPFLLFTKPRQKSAGSIWDIVNSSVLAKHELLNGTKGILQGERDEEDQLISINTRLIDQIARQWLSFISSDIG